MRYRALLPAMIIAGCCVHGCSSLGTGRPSVSVRLPIIDVHGHLNGDMTAEQLIRLMDEAGVRSMVLMARYYRDGRSAGSGSDDQALEFARQYPGRFIPFVAGQRGDIGRMNRHVWEAPSQVGDRFIAAAERKLQTGGFRGLGEFILKHYAYSNFGSQGGGDVDLPVDSYLMHRIAAIGVKYRVPVLLHLEAEPDQAAALSRVLTAQPATRFIWAHNCGRSSARQIREFLTRYPNLMCDLGGMTATQAGGYGRYWPKRTPWIHLVEDGSGVLFPEMKELFEAFPDRFLLGTDAAHTPALDFYVERVSRFREWLGQLTPAAAERIAFRNAQELFRP